MGSESHSGHFREENIPEFLSRAILNALGLTAFDYDFRGGGDDKAELSASLRNFMCVHGSQSGPLRLVTTDADTRAKGFGLPLNWKVFCQGVMDPVPPSLLGSMTYFPTSDLACLRRHVQLSNVIAQKQILSRSSYIDDGKDGLSRIGIIIGIRIFRRVLLFYLVVANQSQFGRWRLSDDELSPQLA